MQTRTRQTPALEAEAFRTSIDTDSTTSEIEILEVESYNVEIESKI